jgi:hypothetical protein
VNRIIWRTATLTDPSLRDTHGEIFYREQNPTTTTYQRMVVRWLEPAEVGNDALYSTLEDALAQNELDKWQALRYVPSPGAKGSGNVGFPQDSGPEYEQGFGWNSKTCLKTMQLSEYTYYISS